MPASMAEKQGKEGRGLADFTKISNYYILSFLSLNNVVQCNIPRKTLFAVLPGRSGRDAMGDMKGKSVKNAQFFTVISKKLQVSLAIMTDLWYIASV